MKRKNEEGDGKIRMTNVSDESYMVDTYMYHLQSRNRSNFSHPSTNFEIKLSSPLTCDPLKEYFLVSLNSCEIPYSFYGINATNNHFGFSYEADPVGFPGDFTEVTVTIPVGNYNIYQFCTQLETSVDAVVPIDPVLHPRVDPTTPLFTFSYRPILGRIWVTNTSPSRTYIFRIPEITESQFTFPTGFIIGTHVWPAGRSDPGSRCVNMGYTNNLYVRTNFMNSNTYASDVSNGTGGTTNILCKVPIQVLPFEINQFNNYYNASGVKISNFSISSVQVQLTDLFNQVVDLNQMDWEFTLKFKKFRYRTKVHERDAFRPPPEEEEEEREEGEETDMDGAGFVRSEEEEIPLPIMKGGWIPASQSQWDRGPSTIEEERNIMPVLLDLLPQELRMEYLMNPE